MIAEIHNYARLGESFAFETTLSGRHYARLIPQWQSSGYRVKLFFLNWRHQNWQLRESGSGFEVEAIMCPNLLFAQI